MRSVLYSLVALMTITTIMSVVPALAQEVPTMTDDHIAKIKSSCQSALSVLGRIHANDAPVYINRNQTYYSISDKLMARLNSRLTLNRYDATQLVKTSSDFNSTLTKFRSAYKQYDDAMAELIHVDCYKQPVSFYDKVSEARVLRQKVHDIVVQLSQYMNEYNGAVLVFRAQHLSLLSKDRS